MIEIIAPIFFAVLLFLVLFLEHKGIRIGKTIRYFGFVQGLYGSRFSPLRSNEMISRFNCVLCNENNQYCINDDQVKDCEFVFEKYREDITRSFFDYREDVLTREQTEWLKENKKVIKNSNVGLKERMAFYISIRDWLYNMIVKEWVDSEQIFRNDQLTDIGEVTYKMFLACEIVRESICPTDSIFDKIQLAKNVLNTR